MCYFINLHWNNYIFDQDMFGSAPIYDVLTSCTKYPERVNIAENLVGYARNKFPLMNIRIFNVCEVRIENSVTRATVRHHEACRVIPNSYPEWRNFQFAPNNHYWFFFLHTLSSNLGVILLLRWNNYIFDQDMFGSVPIYDVLHEVIVHPLILDGNIQNGWKSRKILSGMNLCSLLRNNQF